jgi:hypothetical protein
MPATVEEKEGTMELFYDSDSGRVIEDGTPDKHEFYQKGAQLEFAVAEKVRLVKVTTPSGNVIITNVKKKV